MAIANELTITSASALDMANTMFGDGIQIVSATYSGDAASSGIYSGAATTIPGIVPGDSGVILSTGNAGDFTDSTGTTDTNPGSSQGTDMVGGVDGDAQLNAAAGESTFDAAIFEASFIPTGDYLTMQFVFSSEEYLEYVGQSFNDVVGVWVNGAFVPLTITFGGVVSIDGVNTTQNPNLYVDNPAASDLYNTQMDGFTVTLSLKAPVVVGQTNTIKIGIADGGDGAFDSNLLIVGDSIQTIALAMEDKLTVLPNSSRTFDILANDNDLNDTGLTITQINDQDIVVGEIVTLGTGEQIRLNADGTITVFSDGDLGSNTFTYTITDGIGNTDVGYVTITTASAIGPDGIVEGSAASDVIDAAYLGDPDGDRIDNDDALGVGGTTGDGDYILAGAGNDSIVAGAGNDVIYAGADNDTVFGGDGNDWVSLGSGNDSFGTFNADSAGNDTVYGDAGNDYILTGGEDDQVFGGIGDDTISGGVGSDTLYGGDGNDVFMVADDHDYDSVDGGLGVDTFAAGNYLSTQGVSVTFSDTGAGSYDYLGTTTAGDFNAIEVISGTAYDDTLNATADAAGVLLQGDAGNDTLLGGSGADTLDGGDDRDLFFGGSGDAVDGGEGGDDLDTLNVTDVFSIIYDPVNGEAGTITFIDNSTMVFSNIEQVIVNGVPYEPVDGTSGADFMDIGYTDAQGDQIDGTDGNNDTIYGYAGGDTIYGGAGDDIVLGGIGNDEIAGGTGNDSLAGESGNDTLTGAAGIDTLLGGDDADLLVASAGDTAYGGEGGTDSDTLAASDVIGISYDGANAENGTLTFSDGSTANFFDIEQVVLNGGNLDGIVYGTTAADYIGAGYVDNNGDIIDAGDAIYAGAGPDDDDVFAGDGNDTILSGAGIDNVYAGTGADLVYTGDGNDYGQGNEDNDTLYGGAGDDFLRGDAGNDSVFGGIGNDTNYGGLGEDIVDTGDGDDFAYGGYGNDTVFGGIGNDTLTGSDGLDQVYGGSGDDLINGSTGADTLYGGDGLDLLFGDEDADVIYGGIGDQVDGGETGLIDNDTLHVADVASVTWDEFNSENGTITFNGGGTLAFVGIENLFVDGVLTTRPDGTVSGTAGDDLIDRDYAGDPDGDRIDADDASLTGAAPNDDLVQAGAGDDIVYAGLGADLVYAGDGQDYLDGGDGNDTLYGEAGGDALNGGLGDDLLDGGAGNDAFDGGEGADTLYGGLDNDDVRGSAGNDLLYGDAGDDRVLGGTGADVLFGGDGVDTLEGQAGNDTLTGGDGADSVLGGDDRDLVYGGIGDTVEGGEGGDDFDTLNLVGYGKAQTNILYGGGNNEAGTVQFLDGMGAVIGTLAFQGIENIVPCFTPGILIETERGAVKVEDLAAGDRVWTRDHGLQPIRWVGQRRMTRFDLIDQPKLNPIRIRAGALGHALPQRDMLVSPQHRMLMSGARAEMFFGESEVLVAATHLVGESGVERVYPNGVTYIHVMFDQHQIIQADGTWTESFQPGDRTLAGMDSGQREELFAIFPELEEIGADYPAARPMLKAHEARVLMSR